MGVIVNSRNYTDNFQGSTGINWLIGNVGDWQKLELECKITCDIHISNNNPAMVSNNGHSLTLMNGDHWNDYGFDVGDSITIRNVDETGNSWIYHFHIDSLQGDTIIDNNNKFYINSGMLPYNDGTKEINSIYIFKEKKPEGLRFTYGLLNNDEADTANLHSFIDGTLAQFDAKNTDTLIGWQNFTKLGFQSGLAIYSCRWKYDGSEDQTFDNNGTPETYTTTYKYKIEVVFMLDSFFEDLDNFENLHAPDTVFDANSLTDNFEVLAFPKYNNPNTVIKSDKKNTKRLGNTGWFNENFNGLPNNMSIDNVHYIDSLSNTGTNQLSFSQKTKITFTVKGISNLSNSTKLQLGWIWTPEDEDYFIEKNTEYQKNLLINTCKTTSDEVTIFNPGGAYGSYDSFSFGNEILKINNPTFTINGLDLEVEFEAEPNSAFSNFFHNLDETNRKYVIWISAGDHTITDSNFSDRVSLLVDFKTMKEYVPPVGPWKPLSVNPFIHPQIDVDNDTPISECDENFFVEDDILFQIPFSVDITGVIPTAMEYVFLVRNTITDEIYKLENHFIDLTQYPTVGGVPMWAYDSSRGFHYPQGNNKNWVKLNRYIANDSGNSKAYLGYYGFKIRWEDWLERMNVPNDFYDNGELHNGFNNDWFEYLGVAGWTFEFETWLYAEKNGNNVKYVNKKPIDFKDYDSNSDLIKTWSYYRDSDNTLLSGGVILDSEPTRVEVVWKNLAGNLNINDLWGTICIEVWHGAGEMEFWQLSSVVDKAPSSPLVGIANIQRIDVTQVSANEVKFSCLVKPGLLQNATQYKLSSRLGCSINRINNDYLLFENGDYVNDTDGDRFIIEN